MSSGPRMGAARAIAALTASLWYAIPGLAAMSSAELQGLAQQTTYEVVVPKVEPTAVRYEKALPLELLSYTERTDRFWSIGTAFAIGPGIYVSAAHVLMSGIGSNLNPPHLRDGSGNTYPVSEVLKFSLHEDYIVFRAKGAPASRVLAPNKDPATGSAVYAVGNALGDGVVVRDGLLTSRTPEDQDGRWKWLRFSAAASPGNSGGPLLDDAGHVIGVITMKSPGENLNYALPISLVLDGSSSARMDVRSSFGVSILRQQQVATYKDEFPLPVSWDAFARTLIEHDHRQYSENQKHLLAERSADLPPRGNVARLLATLDRDADLALLSQQPDDTWGLTEPENTDETELPDGSSLWTGTLPGAFSFRLRRPATVVDPLLHRDPVLFMDTLLKGLKIPRAVGQQAIRITSLGPPYQQQQLTDRFGRSWQLRSWSLGYADRHLVTLALPTPEGYAGLLQLVTASQHASAVASLRLLADYFHLIYRGSLGQWRALQAERGLPPFLQAAGLDRTKGIALALNGLDVQVPVSLLPLDDESELAVQMIYQPRGATLGAAPGGLTLSVRPKDEKSWIGIWNQPHPASGAGRELLERWQKMSGKQDEFTGEPQHAADFTSFWTRDVVGDPGKGLLHEVVLSWQEKGLLPRQVTERRNQLLSGLKTKSE